MSRRATKKLVVIFAAVFLYCVASPYLYGNNGQPNGSAPVVQITSGGVLIPFTSITMLVGAIGFAAKFG